MDADWMDELEEPAAERKPVCTFAKRQTLLVVREGELREYPIGGDEHGANKQMYMWAGAVWMGNVYGYILQRNPAFEHKFYGWAVDRK